MWCELGKAHVISNISECLRMCAYVCVCAYMYVCVCMSFYISA